MELVAKEYAVTEQEKNDLEVYINDAVEVLKANHAEMNKFVMKSVSALSASKARSKELASQGFFGRLWGSITGKNSRMQNAINMSNAQAIYAVGQAVKKLAEQNAMSFELITAVNNKLNHAIVGINEEINELKSNLVVLFKQSRSEIAQLNQRVDALEKCADLERWHDTVEYLTFNDMNYEELPPIDALVCLTNDFYVKSHGEWTFSDLLLLKSTFKELDINLKEKISYKDFVDEIVARPELRDRLFEGIDIHSTVDYIPAYTLLDKKLNLAGEEKYICDTVAELSGKDSGEEISNYLVEQYAINNVGVDYNAGINIFDFSLELLTGLKGYEWQEDEVVAEFELELDEEETKVDWGKYPFPYYKRIAVTSEATLMIDNNGVVHAWGTNEGINNVPEIDECCVSVGLFAPYQDKDHVTAIALGESKKIYYWGDSREEVLYALQNVSNVRWVSEYGFPIALEDGYCIDIKQSPDSKMLSVQELPYNALMVSSMDHYSNVTKKRYMGVSVNNKAIREQKSNDKWFSGKNDLSLEGCCKYISASEHMIVATMDGKIIFGGIYDAIVNNQIVFGRMTHTTTKAKYSNGVYEFSSVIFADYLVDKCGTIVYLTKNGNIDFFNIKDYCKSEYHDFMSDVSFAHECCVNIGEIMGGKMIKDIVALQVVNNKGYARVGMVIMDKNCKVYYLGHIRSEGFACQGIPGEFIGNI